MIIMIIMTRDVYRMYKMVRRPNYDVNYIFQ